MRVAVIAVSLALIGPSFVGAESLGEVAAREREKKKNKAGSGRVLTEADLAKRGNRGNYNNPDEATAAPSDETVAVAPGEVPKEAPKKDEPKPKTDEEVRAEGVTEWKKRIATKDKEIADLRRAISRLEGSPIYMDPTAQADLKKAKEDLAVAEAGLETLREEGRRKGYR